MPSAAAPVAPPPVTQDQATGKMWELCPPGCFVAVGAAYATSWFPPSRFDRWVQHKHFSLAVLGMSPPGTTDDGGVRGILAEENMIAFGFALKRAYGQDKGGVVVLNGYKPGTKETVLDTPPDKLNGGGPTNQT